MGTHQRIRPVQDDKKREFLHELFCKIHSVTLPCVVGGDFNMVRRVGDKSTGQVNIRWMDAFNEFIMDTSLLELQRSGGKIYLVQQPSDPNFQHSR